MHYVFLNIVEYIPPGAHLVPPSSPCAWQEQERLNQQLLNLDLEGVDLGLELRGLVNQHGCGNDGARDAACATQHYKGGWGEKRRE